MLIPAIAFLHLGTGELFTDSLQEPQNGMERKYRGCLRLFLDFSERPNPNPSPIALTN